MGAQVVNDEVPFGPKLDVGPSPWKPVLADEPDQEVNSSSPPSSTDFVWHGADDLGPWPSSSDAGRRLGANYGIFAARASIRSASSLSPPSVCTSRRSRICTVSS